MYEYVNAVVKYRRPKVRFEEMDVRQVPVKDLLRTYENVYLVLTHPVLETEHTLSMRENETIFVDVEEGITVAQWLTANGNDTLPTEEGIPVVNSNYALARDAWQAGYKVDICVPSGSPFNDASDYDKTDIWLTRPDTDYSKVRQYCLATVNGLVHRLDSDNDGLYVKDGTESFRRCGAAHVGLISFLNVGKVHTASITQEMIYNPDPTKNFSDDFYLNVPFDTDNKVMGIVIGGYLHLGTKDTKVLGNRCMKVSMQRIPFLERYMTSRYMIDQTNLEQFHEVSEDNETDYNLQAFYSNECITELLLQSQSFIVGIETDHLTTEVIQTTRTFLPGRFYLNQRPLWPLRTELGLLPSYVTAREIDTWVLRIENNLHQHRAMNDRVFRWQAKVDEKRVSGNPETFARGELIKWGTGTVSIKIPE